MLFKVGASKFLCIQQIENCLSFPLSSRKSLVAEAHAQKVLSPVSMLEMREAGGGPLVQSYHVRPASASRSPQRATHNVL